MPNVFETTDAAGTPLTTYTLGVGQTVQGQLSTGSDHDWYAVTLTAGQTYTFAMTGTGINNVTDTFLRLIGTDGVTQVGVDDDGLQGQNSILTFTASSSGVYYLDAGSFDNSSQGQYGLSFTSGNRASFDLQMGAGVIDTDLSWSLTPGTGATVTYGFRQSAATYTAGDSNISTFTQLTAAQIAAVQQVLQMYSELTGITFQQVNPGGTTNNATLLFANYTDATDGAGAFAYYPESTTSSSAAGDVWLNTQSVSTSTLPAGSYSFIAILHEVGHALGLSHPGLYNAAPGVSITYPVNAQFAQDTQQYSIMSYFKETETGASDYSDYPDTPMLLDVLALQNIYGANMTTRTGDTIYGYGSTAGAIYDFAQNTSPALCLWDAGGTDTLDCSGAAQNQVINLNEGNFFNINGLISNVSIALGAVIENAIGGSGNDNLTGNQVDNELKSSDGNDSLNGGLGADTMDGGNGSDTYFVDHVSDIVGEIFNDDLGGVDTVFSSVTYSLSPGNVAGGQGYGIENLTLTGGTNATGNANKNVISGNNTANNLTGLDGNDTLLGNGGNDTINAGSGVDSTNGGVGNDRIIDDDGVSLDIHDGSTGTDTIDYSRVTLGSISTINLATSTTSVVLGTTETISGFENVQGSQGGEIIVGNTLRNILNGNSGNDTILSGFGNDNVSGGTGNDSLLGEVGNDTLLGGSGRDILIGGGDGDVDVLTSGNTGDQDTFVLGTSNEVLYDSSLNNDYARITDFDITGLTTQTDRIQLKGNSEGYRLGDILSGTLPGGFSGAGIFSTNNTALNLDDDNLIGLVQSFNSNSLNLANTAQFVYTV
jgi:serralysin